MEPPIVIIDAFLSAFEIDESLYYSSATENYLYELGIRSRIDYIEHANE